MKTILTIIGARPQFIKHAAVQIQLQKMMNAITVHTGQHFDNEMSQIFFDQLNIPSPDFLINKNTNTCQGAQTAHMMIEIEKIINQVKPNAILVYGDTNSTLAGSLIAIKSHIPLIHIEAGLRSFNIKMPEEVNRVIADKFSDLLFCPNNKSIDNLKLEGIKHKNIHKSGDVMYDSLKMVEHSLKNLKNYPYYFATLHRPYNVDSKIRLEYILNSLNQLDQKIIFSLHPRTKINLKKFNINVKNFRNIQFIKPVGYIDSLSYQKYAKCIITDSGGIQKEAYWLKRKCITIRTETEWEETLEYGWNELIFDNLDNLNDYINIKPRSYNRSLYGNGRASIFISKKINSYLNKLKINE